MAGETGSVTRAAELLCISQPTISAAIAHLENVFEVQLFVRHHAKGLALTSSGRKILTHANVVLKQAEDLHNIVNDMAKSTQGTVNVGWFLTLAPVIAPSVIREFQNTYERVRVACIEADHDAIFEGLTTAKFDMAITYELDVPDTLAFDPLKSFPPHVILPSTHPLASQKSVHLKTLESEPLVLLDLPHSRQYFESLFEQVDVKPTIRFRSKSPNLVRSMVANEFGYSVMNIPIGCRDSLDGKRFVKLELVDKVSPIVMGILKYRDYHFTRAASLFYDFCKQRVGNW